MQALLARDYPAYTSALTEIRAAVRQACLGAGCDEETIAAWVLAVNEACMNVIEHAYGSGRRGEIVLEIHDNGQEIEIVLTDFAAPIDLDGVRPRALDDLRPGGLGTHFMNTIMDRCVYSHLPAGGGNVLRMTKRLAP